MQDKKSLKKDIEGKEYPVSFFIKNTTKNKIPNLPFEEIKNTVLGKKYELSFVYVGTKKALYLNKTYRKKDYPTDILSFPLSSTSGEIIICPEIAKKKSKEFEIKPDLFIGYLFIHGLFHLKGMEHSDTMDKAEMKIRKKFNIPS